MKRKPDPEKFCMVCRKQLKRKRYNGQLECIRSFTNRKTCGDECKDELLMRVWRNQHNG